MFCQALSNLANRRFLFSKNYLILNIISFSNTIQKTNHLFGATVADHCLHVRKGLQAQIIMFSGAFPIPIDLVEVQCCPTLFTSSSCDYQCCPKQKPRIRTLTDVSDMSNWYVWCFAMPIFVTNFHRLYNAQRVGQHLLRHSHI